MKKKNQEQQKGKLKLQKEKIANLIANQLYSVQGGVKEKTKAPPQTTTATIVNSSLICSGR